MFDHLFLPPGVLHVIGTPAINSFCYQLTNQFLIILIKINGLLMSHHDMPWDRIKKITSIIRILIFYNGFVTNYGLFEHTQ